MLKSKLISISITFLSVIFLVGCGGSTSNSTGGEGGTTDTIAPTVSSVSPTDQATKIELNSNITATFSETMDSSTITTSTFTLKIKSSGTSISGSVTYDANTKTETFDPTSNLEQNTTYEASISTAVKDSAGNQMTSAYTWSFTSALFSISSSAFSDGGTIPAKYAYDNADPPISGSQNKSIPFSWTNIPSGTKSFAISIVDTSANNFIHWLVVNMPSSVASLAEGASNTSTMPSGSSELGNDYMDGTGGYDGPAPPSGTHDYVTTIYALNVGSVDLMGTVTLTQFNDTLSGKILAQASITGKFLR